MSSPPSALPSSPLLPSLAVTRLSTHTYSAHFPAEFCIGSVPHGGYISSIFLSVAATHFSGTLASQQQPDTFILSLNFLRRTNAGPALFRVKDVKLGRQTSVVHITLLQGQGSSSNSDSQWRADASNAEATAVEEVSGYITNTNMERESGPSHSTGWTLHPGVPASSFSQHASAKTPGPDWAQVTSFPFTNFRKATSHIDLWMPRSRPAPAAARVEQWVRMRCGERWTNLHLGYLADYFPLMIDFMEPAPAAAAATSSPSSSPSSSASGSESVSTRRPAKNWYPTLVLNLEVKRRLPPEGVEWLNVVAEIRSVHNGRNDIALLIFDTEGRLVAVSHHVCLVVPVSRNTSVRRKERVNVASGSESHSGSVGKRGRSSSKI